MLDVLFSSWGERNKMSFLPVHDIRNGSLNYSISAAPSSCSLDSRFDLKSTYLKFASAQSLKHSKYISVKIIAVSSENLTFTSRCTSSNYDLKVTLTNPNSLSQNSRDNLALIDHKTITNKRLETAFFATFERDKFGTSN